MGFVPGASMLQIFQQRIRVADLSKIPGDQGGCTSSGLIIPSYQEEMHLVLVSVPESNFLKRKM